MPPGSHHPPELVVFDLDGTLIDSDEALLRPFDRLGIARDRVVMGSAVAEECERLGVGLEEYVDAYDTSAARPFEGVKELLDGLRRWAIVSNKHPRPGRVELDRLGWTPEVALFADAFDWGHKSLGPLLERLGLEAAHIVLVGDSDGDLHCAAEVGCRFIWAGWNPRVAARAPDGEVAYAPAEVAASVGSG